MPAESQVLLEITEIPKNFGSSLRIDFGFLALPKSNVFVTVFVFPHPSNFWVDSGV